MVNVIITHKVKDFSKWKKGFKGEQSIRPEANVRVRGVYHSVENPNVITVMAEFPSVEAVHRFMNNPALKTALDRGGVIGHPEVKILNEI
jgi:hypothetical protein